MLRGGKLTKLKATHCRKMKNNKNAVEIEPENIFQALSKFKCWGEERFEIFYGLEKF
jgi:hypothetical protein